METLWQQQYGGYVFYISNSTVVDWTCLSVFFLFPVSVISAHMKLRYSTDETSAKFYEYSPTAVAKETGNWSQSCQFADGCDISSRVGDAMVVEVTAIINTMTWGWSFRFSETFSSSSGTLWQAISYRRYKWVVPPSLRSSSPHPRKCGFNLYWEASDQ